MMNALMIKKDSDFNDFIKILYKFTKIGGIITEIRRDNNEYTRSVEGKYEDLEVNFIIYKKNIELHSNLNVERTYQLYKFIMED